MKASLVAHLCAAPYTTNVRELDALLWRAMSASTRDAIEWLGDGPPPAPGAPPPPDEPSVDVAPAQEAPEPSEAEVRAALAEHGGNVVRSAQALRLSSRYVLYRLMRKHGIEG